MIRSAEHAAALYADLVESTTSTRGVNPGERVRRPKGLACPKCDSRKWKLGAQGKIVCNGGTKRKCKQVWPSEFVSDTGARGPKGRPPAERAMEMRCTLGVIFSTRTNALKPPPATRWQLAVLEMHAKLGRTATPGGRISALTEAMRRRHPGTRYGAWETRDVLHLLRGAEKRIEARLRWCGLMA